MMDPIDDCEVDFECSGVLIDGGGDGLGSGSGEGSGGVSSFLMAALITAATFSSPTDSARSSGVLPSVFLSSGSAPASAIR